MKSIRIFTACAAVAALLSQQVQAQTPPPKLVFGGAVLNHDTAWATDFAQMSQTQVFGTARSMAMGGAMTSLGADMSSMSINPAGLGMFRGNEFSLTPLVSISHGGTPGTDSWQGNNKSRFALANIGVAINAFQSSSNALTNLTIGFGMNRVADFNTRYSYSSYSRYDPSNQPPSIGDIFAQQLAMGGVKPTGPGPNNDPNGPVPIDQWNPFVWPAILGYDTFLVSNTGTVENPNWGISNVGPTASILHSMDVVNSGSINEFTLSMGMNFNNIVYFGASLGIQSVHKKTGVTYRETYRYEDPSQAGSLDYMDLYQQSVFDGSGVNFKLGVIVRPIGGLRLGLAFHTPTYYSLNRSYRADAYSNLNENYSPTHYDEGGNDWTFVSPAKLLFGASYTFGRVAILSVDYQRDWYNGIRVKNVGGNSYYSTEGFKGSYKENFRATNTLRAGLEVKPIPILALRLGGGYTDSMLQDNGFYTDRFDASTPVTCERYYITAGVGISLSRSMTLDLAYQNLKEKMTDYRLFFSYPEGGGPFETYSDVYNTELTRHFISMSLGFRF